MRLAAADTPFPRCSVIGHFFSAGNPQKNRKRPDAGEASGRFLGKKKEKEKRGYQNR